VTQSLGVLVAFTAGLFSFLSPCVLPLFPSYLSFITGMSVNALTDDVTAETRRRIVLHSLAFVSGFSMIFVALGASFSAAGRFLFDYRDWIRVVGGVLIIVFGLYIAGVLRIGVFGRYQQIQLRQKPAGYLGTLLVGVTFAIGWTPCVGPILGSILSLAGTAETVGRGVGLLVAYSVGGARGLPQVFQALPAVHPDRRARSGRAPDRGGRTRRDQLLRGPQRLGPLPHARLAPPAPLDL
jgi:cytochrome c-type biogenesis protein